MAFSMFVLQSLPNCGIHYSPAEASFIHICRATTSRSNSIMATKPLKSTLGINERQAAVASEQNPRWSNLEEDQQPINEYPDGGIEAWTVAWGGACTLSVNDASLRKNIS
jgi:hypothetical protein